MEISSQNFCDLFRVNSTQNYDPEYQRPWTKFYLFLIHLIHVLRLNSGQPSYLRYEWTCSLIFLSQWASQSHTGTRTIQCVNSFLLCNIRAISNNIKITDKKYILQLIQCWMAMFKTKNKVEEEDCTHPMMQNT